MKQVDLRRKISPLKKEETLERARSKIFYEGIIPDDASAGIAVKNMEYGLASMLMIQEELGYDQDAMAIFSLDACIPRDQQRFDAGFGYGCGLFWGDGSNDFVILDVKPDGCGMLVVGLDYFPEYNDIAEKIRQMSENPPTLDGKICHIDFGVGNHFIDVGEVVGDRGIGVPQYVVIFHGATRLFGQSEEDRKKDFHFNTYFYKPGFRWADKIVQFKTPFSTLHLLLGQDAKEYYKHYTSMVDWTHKKRELIANLLLKNSKIISHVDHQGLPNPNTMLLGVHYPNGDSNPKGLYPLALYIDRPFYLYRSTNEYPERVLRMLENEGNRDVEAVKHRVMVPHGGGTTMPDIERVLGIEDSYEETRYFTLQMRNGEIRKVNYFGPGEDQIPFTYRKDGIAEKLEETGLGELMVKILPIYMVEKGEYILARRDELIYRPIDEQQHLFLEQTQQIEPVAVKIDLLESG